MITLGLPPCPPLPHVQFHPQLRRATPCSLADQLFYIFLSIWLRELKRQLRTTISINSLSQELTMAQKQRLMLLLLASLSKGQFHYPSNGSCCKCLFQRSWFFDAGVGVIIVRDKEPVSIIVKNQGGLDSVQGVPPSCLQLLLIHIIFSFSYFVYESWLCDLF